MADKSSEQYELKRLGAIPTKNSGRGKWEKADGILYSPFGDSLITVDIKEANRSLGLTEALWAKVTTDAKKNKTEPLIKAVIGEEEPKDRLVILEEKMFLEMYAAWKEKYYPDDEG